MTFYKTDFGKVAAALCQFQEVHEATQNLLQTLDI